MVKEKRRSRLLTLSTLCFVLVILGISIVSLMSLGCGACGGNRDYRVTFNSMGGSSVGHRDIGNGYSLGSLPQPTRSGYTLEGWYKQHKDGQYSGRVSASTSPNEDMTLYAKWTAIEYSISYDLGGGRNHSNNPVTYTIESPDILLKPATKADATFYGWSPRQSIPSGSTGDMVFVASWEAIELNKYEIDFQCQGGTPVDPITDIVEGSTVQAPDPPTMEGGDFLGWFTDKTGGSQWNFNQRVLGNVTLYAHWKMKTYSLEFKLHGGDPLPYGNYFPEVVHGTKLPSSLCATRECYEFRAWYTDPDLSEGSRWDFNRDTVKSNLILHAGWNYEKFKLTYNLDGGSDPGNPTSYTIKDEIYLKNPTRSGYHFLGWSPSYYIPVGTMGDRIYTAQWEKELPKYTVSFNSYGGSAVSSRQVTHGSLISWAASSKPGYTLSRWCTDPTMDTAWNFGSDQVVASMTLHADWNVETYTISYNNLQGTSHSNPTTYTIESGTIILSPPSSAPTGYYFDGWSPSGIISSGSTGNKTFTANWVPISYSITYGNLLGATHSNPATYTIESATINLTPASREGLVFIGWSPSNSIPSGSTGSKHFNAIWEPEPSAEH